MWRAGAKLPRGWNSGSPEEIRNRRAQASHDAGQCTLRNSHLLRTRQKVPQWRPAGYVNVRAAQARQFSASPVMSLSLSNSL
jgi:hypothetical protein